MSADGAVNWGRGALERVEGCCGVVAGLLRGCGLGHLICLHGLHLLHRHLLLLLLSAVVIAFGVIQCYGGSAHGMWLVRQGWCLGYWMLLRWWRAGGLVGVVVLGDAGLHGGDGLLALIDAATKFSIVRLMYFVVENWEEGGLSLLVLDHRLAWC